MLPIVRTLAAILVFAPALAAASGRNDLKQCCIELKSEMALNKEVYTSSKVALSEANKRLKTSKNFSKSSLYKLVTAFEMVVNEARCSRKSAHYISIIADCQPEQHSEMRTLHQASEKYASKCLTPEYWDTRLKETLGSRDWTGLLWFINEDFLRQYREDHPAEGDPEFPYPHGETCCEPSFSHGALTVILAPLLPDRSAQTPREIVLNNRGELEAVLNKHLFKPCSRYVHFVSRLMKETKDAAKYYNEGSRAFISRLSQQFKDAIFRFIYCNKFSGLKSASEKLAKIEPSLF